MTFFPNLNTLQKLAKKNLYYNKKSICNIFNCILLINKYFLQKNKKIF